MAENNYMANPLVLWIDTFRPPDSKPLEYKDLYNGVFLNDVMQQIDQRPAYGNVQRTVQDVSTRILNWDILVKNIRAYYLEILQQILIWRLPNIQAICREPEKDSSFKEMRKTLLLILGCAVQCEQKEDVIENIKQLDIHVQEAMVEHIKQVTDDSEAVIAIEPSEHVEAHTEKMLRHITRLIRERDENVESLQEMTQERDFYLSQAEGCPAPASVAMAPETHHMAVELAECKAKLRHARQELEDRLEQLSELRDELDYTKTDLAKLKQENADLVQEARATRSLKDELDILKEEASKVDTFEKEILKYKERLNELEFYKARTDELREEVHILEETRGMLEEQLATSRRRVETVVELENKLMKYRQQNEELCSERDLDRERIEMLTEENARLEFEKKSSMNESASLEKELEDARAKVGGMRSSLSDQLTETSNAKILRLELENQRLSAKVREMEEGSLSHSAELNLQLEKENQRLLKRVEKLQESVQETTQKLLEAEEDQEKRDAERRELHHTLQMVRENADRQVQELEQENIQLNQVIEALRERNEKTNDAKMRDLERENKRLSETINAKNTQLSKIEFESRQLNRSYAKLKENVDRISELEQENSSLEKETSELHQKVATLQHSCDKLDGLEQEFSDMEVENRKLQKTVEMLQAEAKKREQLEKDNINLTVEKQKLERTLENLKSSSGKVVELENEKDLLNKELQQVRKLLESQKAHKVKQEQLEFDLLDMDNENQRMQKTLDITKKRLQQLEKDNADIEAEKEELQKQMEALKISSKKLEDSKKEMQELEGELDKCRKEKAAVEKDNRKLRQSLDAKDTSLDEMGMKLQALEQDHKAAKRSLEQLQATAARVKELEKENKDMFQEINAEKKAIATLREELVKEKIQSQELHNQLEKLNQELDLIGINRQKLALAEQSQDENRLKALESLMHETLKKNSEIKDEKIQALETRLEESKNRNLKLQEELRTARRESEAVKQRYEEEVASWPSKEASTPRDSRRTTVHYVQAHPAEPAKEILEFKDHLVALERTNATLLADKNNLQATLSTMAEQCQKLEKQTASLQSHSAALQGQVNSLQSHNAQLQVENTTLQSKSASLATEKSELQTQLANLEAEHDALIQRQEDLSSRKDALARDYESMQNLHKQLTLEYEALISEHGSLKSLHKSLRSELKDKQDKLDKFLQGRDDVNKLREMLEKEQQELQMERRLLGNLKTDYGRVQDEHNQLRGAYDRLSKDYADSLASHKQLKTELNMLQLKHTEQLGRLTECKEQLIASVSEVEKAENRLEAMYQVNEHLENENRTLLEQIKQLLNQNQELLIQALNSKDQYAEETKAYSEKLADLKRQKERLEEKIMEHYKNRMNLPKKNKSIGAIIARKARNIISRAPKRSKSRPDLSTLDSSSQGSGSHGDSSEHISDSSVNQKPAWANSRRHSVHELAFSGDHDLGKQNKSLAKSYSALPMGDSSERGVDDSQHLRGAKMTDDLSRDPVRPEDETDGGFRMSHLLPQSEEQPKGHVSPGSEMLTLKQFLREADREATKSPVTMRAQGRRRSQEDSESRSSDNSDHSGNRMLQRLQPASAAQQPHHRVMSPVTENVSPPVLQDSNAASNQDANLSRLSRISIGSGNMADASSLSPPGPVRKEDLVTSTPKGNLLGLPPRGRDREDRNTWQAGEQWQQNSQSNYAVPHQYNRPDTQYPAVSETHQVTSHHLNNTLSNPEALQSPPVQRMRPMMSNRDLPPIPTEGDQQRDTLPLAQKPDRLSLGGHGTDHGRYSQDERFRDMDRRRSGLERPSAPGGDQGGGREPHQYLSVNSQFPGPPVQHSFDRSSIGDGGRWSSLGNEHEREHPHQFYNEGPQPGSAGRPVPQYAVSQYTATRQPRGAPIPHPRPASVMGHLSSASSRGEPRQETRGDPRQESHGDPRQESRGDPRQESRRDPRQELAIPHSSSRQTAGSRDQPRMRAEPMVTASNGPVYRKENSDSSPQAYIERPKSVPPQLFNKVEATFSSPDVYHSAISQPPIPRQVRDVTAAEVSRVGSTHTPGGVQAVVARMGPVSARSEGLSPQYSPNAAPSNPSTTISRHHAAGVQQQSSAASGGITNLPGQGFSSRGYPPHQQPSPAGGSVGYNQGSPRYTDGSNTQQGQQYGQSVLQGSRYGSDHYPSDPSVLHSDTIYSTPHRPPSAPGKTQFSNHAGVHPTPQQRLSLVANTPGPQQLRAGLMHSQSRLVRPESNSTHHTDPHLHNDAPTPTARILPQTKVPNSSASRPESEQRTTVGDDPSHDRPKQNSVWRPR